MNLLRDDNCAQMIHCFFDNFPIRLNSVILLLFPSSVNGNHFASSTLKHLCKCDCLFARRRNAHFCRYRNVERSHKSFDCLINAITTPILKMRKKARRWKNTKENWYWSFPQHPDVVRQTRHNLPFSRRFVDSRDSHRSPSIGLEASFPPRPYSQDHSRQAVWCLKTK